MPAISVDTFFACSLMVLLVLSAMAGTSKLLHSHTSNQYDKNVFQRYEEISKYLLQNDGTPPDWGQNHQIVPESFGLAKPGSDTLYELDIDKVSRLSTENIYAISYGQIFTTLGISDVSFLMKIEPIFEVSTSLNDTFEGVNSTIYEFQFLTEKHGFPVETEIKCYVVAESYLEEEPSHVCNGRKHLNVTLPNNVSGPALLFVLARCSAHTKMVSFDAYTFTHNSEEPQPNATFLRLSPLNYSLNVSFRYPEINMSTVYALTFNYTSALTQVANDSNSATYTIPRLLDSTPTVIVATGWNSTSFFPEWTTYPPIPIQTGANLADSSALSNVLTYTYTVTIGSAICKCTIWLGGPR